MAWMLGSLKEGILRRRVRVSLEGLLMSLINCLWRRMGAFMREWREIWSGILRLETVKMKNNNRSRKLTIYL